MLTNNRKFDLAAQGLNILKKVSTSLLQTGYSGKELSFMFGKSEAWMSQALSYGGVSKFTIDMVPILKELLGLDFLRILANGSDCFVAENPKPNQAGVHNFQKVLKEFAHLAGAVARAYEDGAILGDEKIRIRKEFNDLVSVGETFVRTVEGG